jgi:hypothetical protein
MKSFELSISQFYLIHLIDFKFIEFLIRVINRVENIIEL